ncbi:hypothetical protein [Pendulispora albinea]|uniref:Uncharacterized protein n=1 Tax=Pendulispora albinea TaxID=2741071 RepID=A0ABZ2M6D2_9BACT
MRNLAFAVALGFGLVACSSDDASPTNPSPNHAPSETDARSQTPPGSTAYGPRVTPGIAPGVTLRDAPRNFVTSRDGQLIENLVFRSQPKIRHARVHFRNCKWVTTQGDNHWAFDPADFDDLRTAGVIFERNDFADALPAIYSADPAQPAKVIASIFRGTSDGYGDSAKVGSNLVIEDSVFQYDHPTLPYAHADGLQSDMGSVAHVTVRYSYFDVTTPGANAALLQNEVGDEVGDWLIEHNHIHAQGAYPVRIYHLTGSGRATVRENRIDRIWIYGPLDITDHPELVDWTNNVDEKGAVIPRP